MKITHYVLVAFLTLIGSIASSHAQPIQPDDLIGSWSGTVVTTMRTPADHAANTPPREDKQTSREAFQIVRRKGQLVMISKGAEQPIVVSRGAKGELIDRSQEDTQVITYTLTGGKLRVETEIKGHFGGTSVGLFARTR